MADDRAQQDLMGYEAMAQDALRGVVRSALKRAAAPEGLPGGHHFYITFKTRGAGVSVPADLADFSVMFSRFPLCRHDFDARERDRAVSRRKSSPVDSSIACGQLRP